MLAVTAHSFDCCKLRVFCSWYASSNLVSSFSFFFSQGISCILEIFSLCIPPTSSSLCMNVLTFVQRPSPWSFIKKCLPQCFFFCLFFFRKMWGQKNKNKMKQCLDICTVRTIFSWLLLCKERKLYPWMFLIVMDKNRAACFGRNIRIAFWYIYCYVFFFVWIFVYILNHLSRTSSKPLTSFIGLYLWVHEPHYTFTSHYGLFHLKIMQAVTKNECCITNERDR